MPSPSELFWYVTAIVGGIYAAPIFLVAFLMAIMLVIAGAAASVLVFLNLKTRLTNKLRQLGVMKPLPTLRERIDIRRNSQ